MERNELEVTRMSHFVGVGLVLGFLLPHTFTAFLLVNPLLCLFYQCYRQNRVFYKYNWIVIVPILLTLLINLPQAVSSKAMMSCFSILLYFFCFPMVGRVKIPNGYFYFILGFILLSQVAYAFDIAFMKSVLNTYYPISEDDAAEIYQQDNINAYNLLDFRLGGLFHNSNQCARYITFLLAGFLVLNSEKPIRKMLPFIIICFYAVLLTGSRTGFVVASVVIIAFLFIDKRISAKWRVGVVLAAILGFLFLVYNGSDMYRGFNVIEGFDNSANAKYYAFADYLAHEESLFRLLLGYLDEDRFEASVGIMKKFDADYGYLVFQYGFVGFVAILLLFFSVFRRMDKMGKVFLVILLWMISSTIVTSYRAVFVFMLLLSLIYNQHKKQLPN